MTKYERAPPPSGGALGVVHCCVCTVFFNLHKCAKNKLYNLHSGLGFSNLHNVQIRNDPPIPQFAQMRKEKTVQLAQWAHMRHCQNVCLSVLHDLTKNQTGE